MTSELHEDFRTHLDGGVTQLATIIDVVRTDGKVFYLTSHDADLVYDGNTYKASSGFDRSSISRSAQLSVDDIEIEGLAPRFILNSEDIKAEELSVGLFDGARILVRTVVWGDPSIPPKKDLTYIVGPITQGDNGVFRMSVMSLTEYLQQGVVRAYTVKCQHDLGDSRCRVPIHPDIIERDTTYTEGDYVRIHTDSDVVTTQPNGEPTYDAFENRIYRCITAGTTAAALTVEINDTFDFVNADSKIIRDAGDFETDGFTVGWKITFPDNVTNDGVYTITSISEKELVVAESVTDQSDFVGDADLYLEYDTAVDGETQDGTAVFVAEEAWTRHGTVLAAASNQLITVDVDESRATGEDNDWFNYGLLTFETGNNAGFSAEVKVWDGVGSQISFFPQFPPFPIEVGDKIRIYAGCDKRDVTCSQKFDNIINHLGFAFIAGQRVVSEVAS